MRGQTRPTESAAASALCGLSDTKPDDQFTGGHGVEQARDRTFRQTPLEDSAPTGSAERDP